MFHEPILADAQPQPPRRLLRAWGLVRYGLPAIGRYRRYIISIAVPLALIWGLTIVYLVAAPVRYSSKMTLILPGSGAGGSLNVADIGQASSTTSSAFSSPTLSPTENYKRLLMSDITKDSAAARVKVSSAKFPDADIQLTDQTNLIEVSLKGNSPKDAHDKLEAIRQAFLANLDALRVDEAQKREQVDRDEIERLQTKAHQAQLRLMQFQQESGLTSVDQFNQRITALDALRARHREALTTLRQQAATTARLSGSLGTGVGGARIAMVLKADPAFQSLLGRYAQIATGLAEKSATLGERHGLVSELTAQDQTLRDQLAQRGAQLTGMVPSRVLSYVDLSVSDGRSALMQSLVSDDSQASGARAAEREIARQIGEQTGQSRQMLTEGARLADLDRDLKVADAVLSSALARLDTNKADPFASYPLVQTLEAPTVPDRRASPSLALALAGAVGASLLVFIGFGLAWIRQPIIHLILRKA